MQEVEIHKKRLFGKKENAKSLTPVVYFSHITDAGGDTIITIFLSFNVQELAHKICGRQMVESSSFSVTSPHFLSFLDTATAAAGVARHKHPLEAPKEGLGRPREARPSYMRRERKKNCLSSSAGGRRPESSAVHPLDHGDHVLILQLLQS